MNNQWWEATDMQDAWKKIIMDDHENPEESLNTASVILEGIPKGKVALDIGCGVGRLMKEMVGHFEEVYGVDVAETMVQYSKEYLQFLPQCLTFLGDGEHLPLAGDGAIDFVYSFITFQHMPSLEVIRANIEEIARVLRPGGVCRIQTIKGDPFYCRERESAHYLFRDEQDFLAEFTRAGLTGEVKTGIIHPATIWVTARKP